MTATSPNVARLELIKQRLVKALNVVTIEILDESHKHAGHIGAKTSSGGHFKLQIVSNSFQGKSAIERHKMIYMALGDAMGRDIHAISISAKTPAEAATNS